MAYSIAEDEIALVLRPINLDENGDWEGEVQTGFAVHGDSSFSDETFRYMFDLVTLMAAFLEVMQSNDYVYEAVATVRDEMLANEMGENIYGETDPKYEEVEGTEGKVLRLTPATPTKGNA
jgi:hypothetical protein